MSNATLAIPEVNTRTTADDATLVAKGFLAAYSGHTLIGYTTDLRLWFAWCHNNRISVLHARRADIETYARLLEAEGKRPATVQRRLTTITGYYRYAEEEDIITKSPGRYVRRPRVPQESMSLFLDRIEMGRFLQHATMVGGYEHALACLLLLNGLRVSEACGASAESLRFSDGYHTLTIMGKGGKPAVIPLAPKTIRALLQALDERTSGPLLLNRHGQPMGRHNAAQTVRRLCRGAGLEKVVGPHALRHSFCTAGLDAGVSLRDMQTSMRHANSSTTTRYDRTRLSLDRNATFIVSSYVIGGVA